MDSLVYRPPNPSADEDFEVAFAEEVADSVSRGEESVAGDALGETAPRQTSSAAANQLKARGRPTARGERWIPLAEVQRPHG